MEEEKAQRKEETQPASMKRQPSDLVTHLLFQRWLRCRCLHCKEDDQNNHQRRQGVSPRTRRPTEPMTFLEHAP
jgi:hypothetical protein